jgi:hypothetical protein
MRLVALVTAALIALPSAAALAAPATPDATRVILLFVVNPPDENAKKGVISWIQSFKNNVRYLLADFSPAAFGGSAINVAVTTEAVDDMDPVALEISFSRQPSLQVLSTVGRFAGQSTFIENEIYLGDFKGSLSLPYVHVSQEVLPGRYKITREALAAVTLYAYAMAIAKVSPETRRFAVCQVLDRANMYKSGDLDSEARRSLDKLFVAIETELDARACGGKK